MRSKNTAPIGKLLPILMLWVLGVAQATMAQTIMFDDFNYSGPDDPALRSFNKWRVIDGVSGPPEGAWYSKHNIAFKPDPNNPANRAMALRTTADGQTGTTTQARIETAGFDYFEGTYAARVYLSDEAFSTKDANIQTFYTIVSSALAGDGTKYSELDIIEYMAADKWGVSPDQRVGYTTSYHKYIPVPWQAWKTYSTQKRSLAGWHVFSASCTDGTHIRYFMDGVPLGVHSVTDHTTQPGLPVYPRSPMQVAFANWIWNNVLGAGTGRRENTFMVDWVLHYKNQALSQSQVLGLVGDFRARGVLRRNLAGQEHLGQGTPPFSATIQAEDYHNMAGVQVEPTTDTGGGQNVGYIDTGDWMSYKAVTFPTAGQYRIEYRVASAIGGGTLSADLDAGAIVLGRASIPYTGGWQNWVTVAHTAYIPAGTYRFGLYAIAGGWNINWAKITKLNGRRVANPTDNARPDGGLTQTTLAYPNPVRNTLFFNNGLEGAKISVANAQGKVFAPKKAHGGLDVSALPLGVYVVIIEKNGERLVMRFVKE